MGASSSARSRRTVVQGRLRGRGWFIDLLVFAAIAAAGIVVRLWNLEAFPLHFDVVDPFLRAQAWLTDWQLALRGEWNPGWIELLRPASAPWLNQFGPGLVWSYVPLVAGASSLEEAFARRYVFQALMAPLTYLVVRGILAHTGDAERAGQSLDVSRPAAFLAALAVGFTGEPFGTAGLGDQTMLAPEAGLVVVLACALAIRWPGSLGFPLAAAALPWAAMIHPMTIVIAPGFALVTVVVWRRVGGRRALIGLVIAAVFSIPEVLHLAEMKWRQGGSAFSDTLGYTSSFHRRPLELLSVASRAWLSLEPRGAGPLLLVAPGVLLGVAAWQGRRGGLGPLMRGVWRRASRGTDRGADSALQRDLGVFGLVVVANLVALVGLGMVTGLLMPYHWRIVLPGHAVALGFAAYLLATRLAARASPPIWLARSLDGGIAIVALLALIGASALRLDRIPLGNGGVAVHRSLAQTIADDAGDEPRWFDAIVLGYGEHPFSWSFTPAIFLEQRMAGASRERFAHPGYLYVTVSGPPGEIEAVCDGMGWSRTAGGGGEADPRRVASAEFPGVHYIGRFTVNHAAEILTVRFDTPRQSRTWTGWLFDQFEAGEVRLMLDCNHVVPLTTEEVDMSDVWSWFDEEMLQYHYETADSAS